MSWSASSSMIFVILKDVYIVYKMYIINLHISSIYRSVKIGLLGIVKLSNLSPISIGD